ncbi:hypothetical protein D9M68_834130 [compost metagenome]
MAIWLHGRARSRRHHLPDALRSPPAQRLALALHGANESGHFAPDYGGSHVQHQHPRQRGLQDLSPAQSHVRLGRRDPRAVQPQLYRSARRGGYQLHHRHRRGGGLSRPQRRRQIHHDQDDDRHSAADIGRTLGAGPQSARAAHRQCRRNRRGVRPAQPAVVGPAGARQLRA